MGMRYIMILSIGSIVLNHTSDLVLVKSHAIYIILWPNILHTQDPLHFMTIPLQKIRGTCDVVTEFPILINQRRRFVLICKMSVAVAACITNSFNQEGDSDLGIAWEMFDFSITKGVVSLAHSRRYSFGMLFKIGSLCSLNHSTF
jgi:hypothetical protein